MIRRPFLILLLALALLGLPLAPPIQGAGLAPAAAPALAAPVRGGDPEIALIDQANRLIQKYFFEPVDTAKLYTKGIEEANAELTKEGVDAQIAQPAFADDAGANWGLFYDAYMSVARPNAAQVDQKKLAYAVISGFTDALEDCHSYFMSPDVYKQQLQSLSGSEKRKGFGVLLSTGADGYPVIEATFQGAPADKAGVRAGDKMLKLDGKDLKDVKFAEINQQITAKIGQPMTLTVGRSSSPNPIDITVTPNEYTKPVWETRDLGNGVGYLRIWDFAETLTKDVLQKVYADLVSKSPNGIVIDLRYNPGGYPDTAVALLSTVIPSGQELFSFVFKDGSKETVKSVNNLWPTKPRIQLLLNKSSASASEIVAAVAQDFGVAQVVGVQTEGCVALAQLTPLSDGSALGIPISLVKTAGGRVLNHVGVTPDYQVDRTVDDLTRGADPQLEAATAVLLGKPLPAGVTATPSGAAAPEASTGAPPAGQPKPPATTAPPAGSPTTPPATAPTGSGTATATINVTAAPAVVAKPGGGPVRQGWALISVEEPISAIPTKGVATVSGWAVNVQSPGTPIDDIRLTVETPQGTVPVGDLKLGLPRPDVAAAVGAEYANAGFSIAVDTTAIPAGTQQLTLTVRAGGNSQSVIVPISIGASRVPGAQLVLFGRPG